MLCRREEGALKTVHVDVLVGTKQLPTKNRVQEKLIRNVVTRERKNVNFSNFASLFLDAYPIIFKSSFVFVEPAGG